jgi:hypothetical protein
MGKKYAGWDEADDADDEIRKGTQTMRADREARRWVQRCDATAHARIFHLHVREKHVVGVQVGANGVGLGVLNKAEHDLARPAGRERERMVTAASEHERMAATAILRWKRAAGKGVKRTSVASVPW